MEPVPGPGPLGCAGAVLCGGHSSRMGRDKALISWDGVPMAARVSAALRAAGCSPVFAVGGDATRLAALGLEVVADGFPGEGPLGGVITALEAAGGRSVMVVACDLPQLSSPTVVAVAASLRSDVDVAVAVTPRWEPLCAAWSFRALAALRAAFDAGDRDLRGRIATLRRSEVAIPEQDLRNVNAPSDLDQ